MKNNVILSGENDMGSIVFHDYELKVQSFFSYRNGFDIETDIPSELNDSKSMILKVNKIASKVLTEHNPLSDVFVESWFDHFHQAGLLAEEYVALLFDLIQSYFNRIKST